MPNDGEVKKVEMEAFSEEIFPKESVLKIDLEAIKAKKNVLIVVSELTDNVILSTRNIPNVVLLQNNEISTLDIIAADTLVITEDAVKAIEEVLA